MENDDQIRASGLLLWHTGSGMPGTEHNDLIQLNLLGRSQPMIACRALIDKLSEYEAPTLVEGETGTGKEMAARAIHYLGLKAHMPFVPVNCGALPDSLMETELFGHERGAFTDAKAPRKGLVALAEGGTLFLDEVDSLSAKGQVVLLRFLQNMEYRPVGGGRPLQSRMRVIAATNSVLERRVSEGRFRQDLFFRLNVTRLRVPTLRERAEDIPLLAHHFLAGFGALYGKPAKTLRPESVEWLIRQPWPGNVRELENLMHREFLLTDGPVIRLPSRSTGAAAAEKPEALVADGAALTFTQAKAKAIVDFERVFLHRLMVATKGNVSQAARKAGKERRSLGRLLQKHSIDRQGYLDGEADAYPG